MVGRGAQGCIKLQMTVSDSEWHSLKCCLHTNGEFLLWKPRCSSPGTGITSSSSCSCFGELGVAYKPWLCCKTLARPETHRWASGSKSPSAWPALHPEEQTAPGPCQKDAALCGLRGPLTGCKGCGSLAPPACWPGERTLPSSSRSKGSSPLGLCQTFASQTPKGPPPRALSGVVGWEIPEAGLPSTPLLLALFLCLWVEMTRGPTAQGERLSSAWERNAIPRAEIRGCWLLQNISLSRIICSSCPISLKLGILRDTGRKALC